MLNGIDPIVIFEFYNKVGIPDIFKPKVPVGAGEETLIALPPIPIYLSERLTGLYIDSEDKNVEVETSSETMADGSDPKISQKGIASSITINIFGKKNVIGLSLLTAMIDLLYLKVSANEYSITYLHGAVTVFGGLLQSFSVNQTATTDLLAIKMEITKGSKNPVVAKPGISVDLFPGALPA